MVDVLSSLRRLAHEAHFSLAVVLCLALGTGTATLIATVAAGVLWRPLPVEHLSETLMLWDTHGKPGAERERLNVSPANFMAWQERAQVFASLAALDVRTFNLTGLPEPEVLRGARVSADAFSILGLQAVIGRPFVPGEDRTAGIALLGESLWRRRFGADAEILGRSLELDGRPHRVVGVVPAGFRFPEDAEVWTPLPLAEEQGARGWNWHTLFVLARLRPGVTREAAQAEMDAVARHLQGERPETNTDWGVRVGSLSEHLVGDLRLGLLVLGGAVAILLLIACANVSNLVLVRAVRLTRDLALRSALGAGRLRLIRQVLIESLLLSLAGGLGGLLLARWSLAPVVAMSPLRQSAIESVAIDLRAVGFGLVLSLSAGGLCGAIPALRVARPDIFALLRAGGGRTATADRRERRLQSLLVVAEVALALTLLVGAGLLLKNLRRLEASPTGFEADDLLAVRLLLPDRGYARPEVSLAFCEELRQRAAALPGVRSAALSTNLPVADRELNQLAQFSVEDRPPESRSDAFVQNFRRVSSDYFRTVGIPLRAGRAFDETDRADAPGVVVVSERLAELYWPGTSPIGRRMKRGVFDSANPWLTVVGVVGDVRDAALDLPPAPTFYLPFAQNPGQAVSLVLATAGDPTALAGPVRGIVRELDPDLPVYRIASMEQVLADSLAKNRFSAFVLGTFSSLGLILAVVGLYALVSYTVSQQHREIAVRMTMGARAGDIVRMIVRRSLALTAIGLAGGVLGALALGRILAGELYGVSPADPVVFAATAALLAAVAALAGYIPARRAARTDPVALVLRAG